MKFLFGMFKAAAALLAVVIVIAAVAGGSRQAPPATASASPGAASRPEDPQNPIFRAFVGCLVVQGKAGPYTSRDGGKSAIGLMAACNTQWQAWHERCVAERFSDDGAPGCRVQAGLVAQQTLLSLGK